VSRIVLDASAILAVIRQERGMAAVLKAIPDAAVSTVNLTEVLSKLIDGGDSDELAAYKAQLLSLTVIPFDESQAKTAGYLRRATAAQGLSLGDRACIALGLREGSPVMTADRGWAALDLGVEVVLIR
jgi:PIN domain nuclease of toxin-antitoxin system